ASRPSLFWWESFHHVMPRAIEPFMFHFLTRNMRVTRESLLRRDPAFARRVEEWHTQRFGGDAAAGVRGLELAVREVRLRSRLVSYGPPEEGAALALLSPDGFDAAPSGDVPRGLRVDRDQLGALDLDAWRARCAWLEVSLSPGQASLRAVEECRRAWPHPLSIAIEPRGRPVDEVVAFAIDTGRAGADVVGLAWHGKEQPDIVACAEAIRVSSPELTIAVDPAAAAADADTLVL